MPSFGEKLKLEREKRKITLDQISASTKIGTRMLQALEEDKFTQLPGGIFNKGFVRAYARTVGLDEDQAVADYLQASGEAPAARPDLAGRDSTTRDGASRDAAAREEGDRISRLEAISDEPSRSLPWGVFAIILLVIALLLSLWSHRRRERERLDTHPAPATTGERSGGPVSPQAVTPNTFAISTSVSTPKTSAHVDSPSASGDRPGAAVAAPTQAEKVSFSPGQASPQGDQPASLGSPSISQSSSARPAPGEFLVLIHAREESWVSVSVDGKPVGSELLGAGSERTFHAHRGVFVKAGNAGALDFQLDGKKLEVGGEYGEVKSVTIGHAGLIPNAAPPPTTP